MKKSNIRTKTHNLYKVIFLFVVFLGIGYAFLEATLNIEGNTTVEAPELNVYVQSTSVTSGSTAGTPTIIGTDKKEVDFTTALTNDVNSFYEVTTTVVNKGTGTPYLLGVDVKVYDSSNNEVTLSTPYKYSVTNGDGTPIQLGTQLAANSTSSFKFKFNYISGTDMTTVTDYPTYTFKITYNYGFQLVCSANENVTTLSTTKCSANENVQVPQGTICKRAINLHQEECTQTDSTKYCSGAGYATGSTITYGQCGTQGNALSSGDALTCDVNGDGTFDELTERFYYVSDYYDTTTKTFDTTTATLVYYNNTTSGLACNNNSYAYDSRNENWHGPVDSLSQLPTTTQWTNVSLKSTSRAILAENQSTHDSATTSGGTLPTNFSYSGYSARLLTAKELMSGCGLSELGNYVTGELDSCNYLVENTAYAKSSLGSYGYWLETPRESTSTNAWSAGGIFRRASAGYTINKRFLSPEGVRPVIEVLKSKILY